MAENPFVKYKSEIDRLYFINKNTLNNKTQSLELEARFKKIQEPNPSHLTNSEYLRLKKSLLNLGLKHSFLVTQDEIMNGIRKTISGNTSSYIRKEPINTYFDSVNYGVKIAMSIETKLEHNETRNLRWAPTVLRTKHRDSFIFNNSKTEESIRMDLTRVEMTVNGDMTTQYEIELESVKFQSSDFFLKTVYDVARLINQTQLLYDVDTLKRLNKTIKNCFKINDISRFNSEQLVQARNIKREDLVYGGIVGNPTTTYGVAHKADGVRKILAITKEGVWFIMPPYEYDWVSNIDFGSIVNTFIDGELIPNDKRRTKEMKSVRNLYLSFDCICSGGDVAIQERPLHERLYIATTIGVALREKLPTTMAVYSKDIREFKTPVDFFSIISSMLLEQPSLAYETDGFMMTPEFANYNMHGNNKPNSDRVLTNFSEVVKWKPIEHLTIDFAIVPVMGDEAGKTLYSLYNSNGKTRTKFEGTAVFPFDYRTMVEHDNPIFKGLDTNKVVEFKFDYGANKLVPTRVRWDKPYPNRFDVALSIWKDIFMPITFDLVKTESKDLFVMHLYRTLSQLLMPVLKTNKVVVCVDDDIYRLFFRDVVQDLYDRDAAIGKNLHLYGLKNINVDNKIINIAKKIVKSDIVFNLFSFPMSKKDKPRILVSVLNVDRESQKVDYVAKDYFVWDSWTLNYEQFMNEASLESAQHIRVIIQSSDKLAYQLYPFPAWKQKLDYPEQRLWSFVEEDEEGNVKKMIQIPSLITIGKAKDNHKLVFHTTSMTMIEDKENENKVTEEPKKESKKVINATETEQQTENELEKKTKKRSKAKEKEICKKDDLNSICLKDKKSHKNKMKELYQLAPGAIENINCSWYDEKVYRVGTLGKGSCFIHALLTAIDDDYTAIENETKKYKYADTIRAKIASILEKKNPRTGVSFYESISDGSLALLGTEDIEYSIKGIKTLLLSNQPLGDEIYWLIGDVLNVNIHVVRSTQQEIYKHVSIVIDKSWDNVVITGDGAHYELITVLRKEDDGEEALETRFTSNDIFITSIENKAPNFPYLK